jgi:hypothetical protein
VADNLSAALRTNDQSKLAEALELTLLIAREDPIDTPRLRLLAPPLP